MSSPKKIVMGNLKNFLFVAVFMLFGLGVQADTTPYTPSICALSLDAPLNSGIIHVVQGRHKIRVRIETEGPVELTMFNSSGETVYQSSVQVNKRVVNIDTKNYAPGVYTLVAESLEETEEIMLTVK